MFGFFAGDGEHVGRATVPSGANLSFRRDGAWHAVLRVLGKELPEEQRDACVILQPGTAHLGTAVHCTSVPGNLKPGADNTIILKHKGPTKGKDLQMFFKKRAKLKKKEYLFIVEFPEFVPDVWVVRL